MQVVLARDRLDKSKYVALKVVFLQAPEVVDDPELLTLLTSCVTPFHATRRIIFHLHPFILVLKLGNLRWCREDVMYKNGGITWPTPPKLLRAGK